MNTYSQAIPAGQSVHFPGGGQFHLLQTSAPVTITFYGAMGQVLEKAEDIQAGFRVRYRDINGVDMLVRAQIYSATAQTVKIGITQGDAVYDRSQGDVNVVSGIINQDISDRYYTDQNNAFIGMFYMNVASNYWGYIQFLNPTGSGKVAYLKRMVEKCNLGDKALVADYYSTAIANLGNSTVIGKAQGISPSCQLRYETTTSLKFDSSVLSLCPQAANFEMLLKDPIKLSAGQGFMLGWSDPTALVIGVVFEWIEVNA